MKKKIFGIIFFALLGMQGFAESDPCVTVYTSSCDRGLCYSATGEEYSIIDDIFAVAYSEFTNFGFCYQFSSVTTPNDPSGFVLGDTSINQFKNVLKKCLEWGKIAKEKQVSIEKEIPNSKIFPFAIVHRTPLGNDCSYTATINFTFESDGEYSLLKISSDKTPSYKNKITIKMDNFYLDMRTVEELYNALSDEESIKKRFREKQEKTKRNDELFQ